jgi:iron complex outermembrane receptor protein
VLVDGYPRSSGSSYDASAIDRIEVLKGPASLLYGMQYSLGGVINLVLK